MCEVLLVLWSSVKGMMGHGLCEVGAGSLLGVVCPLLGFEQEAEKKGVGSTRVVNDCFGAGD